MREKSFLPLTAEQVMALRATPLGTMPNKVALALTMLNVQQGDAAAAMDMPRASLSKIVNGRYEDIQLDTARRVSEFFGCAIEDLFPSREAIAS
jgi:DNA-binding XRE family transcriptional regulator